MFEQSILKGASRTRRTWTVMLASLGQLAALGAGFLLPLVAFERMPQVRLVPPLPPPRWTRPQPPTEDHVAIVGVPPEVRPGKLFVPPRIPSRVEIIVDPPPIVVARGPGVLGGIGLPGGPTQGVIGSLVGAVSQSRPPEPSHPETTVAAVQQKNPERITLGGLVVQAKLIRRVTPVYPPLAIQTHVSGTVRLQAVIARDGHIQQLQLLSGHGLLVRAAQDAVRQWLYRPTLLNGVPVEVLTTIDVIFTLTPSR
jgi:protein TonB